MLNDMLKQNPLLSSLVALIVGLFLGLVVLGWGGRASLRPVP